MVHLAFIGMIYGFLTSHYTVLLCVSTALSSIKNCFTAEKKITRMIGITNSYKICRYLTWMRQDINHSSPLFNSTTT